jgi:hypothetical protein
VSPRPVQAAALEGSAYNMTFYIDNYMDDNPDLLNGLDPVIRQMCSYLNGALHRQAGCGELTVIVPDHWECPQCEPRRGWVQTKPDFYIGPDVRCGACARFERDYGFISIDDGVIMNRTATAAGRTFVHEWGHYRYAIYDEYMSWRRRGGQWIEDYHDENEGRYVACNRLREKVMSCRAYTVGSNRSNRCAAISDEANGAVASLMDSQWNNEIVAFCDDSGDSTHKHDPDIKSCQNDYNNGKSSWAMIEETDGLNQSTTGSVASGPSSVKYVKSRKPNLMIAMDVSGSMATSGAIYTARAGAINLINQAEVESKIGIVAFTDSAMLMLPLTEIVEIGVDDVMGEPMTNRADIAASLPMSAMEDTWTSVGAGMLAALSQFSCDGTKLNVMAVMSDGDENRAPYSNDVYGSLNACGVILHSIGLTPGILPSSSSAEGTWFNNESMMHSVPRDDPSALNSIFTTIINQHKKKPPEVIFRRRVEVGRGAVEYVDVVIDPDTAKDVAFRFYTPPNETGEEYGGYYFSLVQPAGTPHLPGSFDGWLDRSYPGYSQGSGTGDGMEQLKISGVAPSGVWRVNIGGEVSGNGAVVHMEVLASATQSNKAPIKIVPRISKVGVTHPEPVKITVSMHQGGDAIIGANVVAKVRAPDGNITILELRDNGQGADSIPIDGMYSGYFTQYTGDGEYSVDVVANNSSSKGVKGIYAKHIHGVPSANLKVPESLGYNFSRTKLAGVFKLTGYTEEDRMPPSRITSLYVDEFTKTSVKLGWIGTGDDYGNGKTTQYVIRYSKGKIDSHQKFTESTVGKTISSPKDPHISEEAVISDLDEGATYYFALVAIDKAGNESPLSNKVKVNLSKASAQVISLEEAEVTESQGENSEGSLEEDKKQTEDPHLNPNAEPAAEKSGGCQLIRY